MPMINVDDTYVQVVMFEVDDAEKQQALYEGILGAIESWVATLPGFVSASFHMSHDGTRLLNYAQWESRAAFENFSKDNRRERTIAAIRVAGVRNMSAHSYSVAKVIYPR